MNYLKFIQKNIPKKLEINNVVYTLLLLIVIISFLKKDYKFLSMFVIIQCLIFLLFSNKDKNIWMLTINILALLCLFFLFIKSKTNIDEAFKGLKKRGKMKEFSKIEKRLNKRLNPANAAAMRKAAKAANASAMRKAAKAANASAMRQAANPANASAIRQAAKAANASAMQQAAKRAAETAERAAKTESKINTELQKRINMQKELQQKNANLLQKKTLHDNKVNTISKQINKLNDEKIANMKASDEYEKSIKDIKGKLL